MKSSFPKLVTKPMTIQELSQRIGIQSDVIGELETEIYSVASPNEALEGSIVFIAKEGKELEVEIKKTKASVVIAKKQEVELVKGCIVLVDDVRLWYIKAVEILNPIIGIIENEKLLVSKNAKIGRNVSIGLGTIISDGCIIGDNTTIGTNCYIGEDVIIGENCFIQHNNTIGSVGLGYHFTEVGERVLFPHLGTVIMGNYVVIGSGCTIVRGQLTDTRIGDYGRLGSNINIGHNVRIGDKTVMSSSGVISGGSIVGENCNIAAGVTINAKITVGDSCMIGLGSVVTKSLTPGKKYFGNPARLLPTIGKF